MNDRPEAKPEFDSPAEEALHERLEPVRLDPPTGGEMLPVDVRDTLRWQSFIVLPLTAVVAVADGVVNGLRMMLGARSS